MGVDIHPEVVAVRYEVGRRAGELRRGVLVERGRQPAEEEAGVRRVGDIPVADSARIGAARGPDASEVALLVMEFGALRGVVIRAIRATADRGYGRGIVISGGDLVVREHVRAHGHALVGAGELLQLADGDTSRSQGVEARPQVAGVALGEPALDLQERGENDYHHHHRSHDGQRQDEGETRAFKSHSKNWGNFMVNTPRLMSKDWLFPFIPNERISS